jgi:hypothetical protein
MKRVLLAIAIALLGAVCLSCHRAHQAWQRSFNVDKTKLRNTGTNRYFRLDPGFHLTLRSISGTDTTITVQTVTPDTFVIDGVATRVMKDSTNNNGELDEVTRDYFAIDSSTHDVYYFGEDVDVYSSGQIIGHTGSWRSGVKGAKFGLFLPGTPRVGQRFYHEVAPGLAMDRAEVKSMTDTVTVPAGSFANCLRTEETSELESGLVESKTFGRNVGNVVDADQVLIEYGPK